MNLFDCLLREKLLRRPGSARQSSLSAWLGHDQDPDTMTNILTITAIIATAYTGNILHHTDLSDKNHNDHKIVFHNITIFRKIVTDKADKDVI